MKLSEYFKKRQRGAKTSVSGKQTDWMDFCEFTLNGPKFLVVDASFLPSEEDGLLINAQPGNYLLAAKVMAYGADRRISRLRVIQKGSAPALGRKLGETWTDTARIAICDFQVFRGAWGNDDDASYAKIEKALNSYRDYGIATLDKTVGALAPFVTSGFGDGNFPVYELRWREKRVGFEIQFIADNEPFPFREEPPAKRGTRSNAVAEEGTIGDILARLGKAMKEGKPPKNASKEENRASVAAVFKQVEDELLGELKKAFEQVRLEIKDARSKATAHRHDYRPATDDSFLRTSGAQARIKEITQEGFIPGGVFQVVQSPGIYLGVWIHPELRVLATLAFSKEGINCDIGADYSDRTSFIVTDCTRHSWMDQPPWRTMLRRPAKSFRELLDFFLEKVPDRPRMEVSVEAVETSLAPDANRYLFWRHDRGGFTTRELQGLAREKNPAKADDQAWLKERRLDAIERALYNWLRCQEQLPFKPEDVIADLVIIHDELTPDLMQMIFACTTSDHTVRESHFEQGSPREAFARVNVERGAPLQKVAEKTTGLAADFYLAAGL